VEEVEGREREGSKEYVPVMLREGAPILV